MGRDGRSQRKRKQHRKSIKIMRVRADDAHRPVGKTRDLRRSRITRQLPQERRCTLDQFLPPHGRLTLNAIEGAQVWLNERRLARAVLQQVLGHIIGGEGIEAENVQAIRDSTD